MLEADGSSLAHGGRRAAGRHAPSNRPRPVLIVLHQEHSTPGHIGRLLRAKGYPLDVRRPRFGDPLPRRMSGHAGAVVFGGPMSANDRDRYIRREIAFIGRCLRQERPFLGICLGAQMMAIELGARVFRPPAAEVEIGYHPIRPLERCGIGGAWPSYVYQWHREGFDLPAGAVPLAAGHGPFEQQAFAYGRAAIGIQFHPEITYAMVARWSARNESKLGVERGAQDRFSQLADHIAHGPAVQRWLDGLLDAWLALGGE